VSTSTVTLNWQTQVNATRYEIRYQVKAGSCKLNIDWHKASSSGSLTGQSYSLGELNPGTIYCVAIRAGNATAWSPISNQLELRTTCADPTTLYSNYTVSYGVADNSTGLATSTENIMIVTIFGSGANYQIILSTVCTALYGVPTALVRDQNQDRSMLEFQYDPITNKLTGNYRYCQNGAWYSNQILGNRCKDLATWWGGKRWQNNSMLVDVDTVRLADTTTNKSKSWMMVFP